MREMMTRPQEHRRPAAAPPVRRDEGREAEPHPMLAVQRAVGNRSTLAAMPSLAGPATQAGPPLAMAMGLGLLQRTPAAAVPAPPALSADAAAALRRMTAGTMALDDTTGWAALASAGAELDAEERTLHGWFKSQVDAGTLTWENITAAQRKVFKRIAGADREALRLKAVQKSKLYAVLTEMHLSAADPTRRSDVETRRLAPDAEFDFYTDALSGKFAEGMVMPEMLLAEVPADGSAANTKLGKYVRKVRDESGGDVDRAKRRLARETKWMACGISNLFAIAASRGQAVPTEAGAKAWLKKVVLDVPAAQALVRHEAGWDLQTNPVLTSLSEVGKAPKYNAAKVAMHGAGGPAKLQQAMAFANALESRVGLIQGSGHMYISYRDMDDVWRTMDMYMSLADKPEGGAPDEAGTSFQKAVVDE
jgi:hypothetical protein